MNNKCKVISITNQKGGVNKTVTAACLGSSLADIGKRVLIVDFDPHATMMCNQGENLVKVENG